MKLLKICLILFDYGNEIRSTYFQQFCETNTVG